MEELSLPDAASSVSSLISVRSVVLNIGLRGHVLKHLKGATWKCCTENMADWLPQGLPHLYKRQHANGPTGICVVSTAQKPMLRANLLWYGVHRPVGHLDGAISDRAAQSLL